MRPMNGDALQLDFDALRDGKLGISAIYGSFLAEAASRCLRFHQHQNPAFISITGDRNAAGMLAWCDLVEQEEATWADLHEATEYGAFGVGIVVALRLAEKARVERSVRGTGIDYWIGHGADDGSFQRAARLEISGILNGDEAKISERLRGKLSQSERSKSSGLPAYVAVIDFTRPEARIVQSRAEAGQ
jgi:hypothetical protein